MKVGWWTLVIVVQVAIGAAVTVGYLWLKQSKRRDRLTKKQLLEWMPLPIVEHEVKAPEPPLMGKIDDNVLNVGATSFLCLEKEPAIMDRAVQTLHKYGVGSCGPRQFYGTTDLHLELEERLARFLQVEEVCVYSYGFSTIASAIPAYAKRGDIIFADEKVWFAIQKGIEASRSEVRYFKHNDMMDLERLLDEAEQKKELNPKRRAFLIAEAIYLNTANMCPLKKLVKLARRYKLRIILDESLTIGVIGKNGRGITEHLDVPRDEIDLIVGSLEHSFATVGGFCAGSHFIVEHQRLCGLGYYFSASQPPMLVEAAIAALDIMEKDPAIIGELGDNSKKMNMALNGLKHYAFSADELSPVKHIYLKDSTMSYDAKQSHLRSVTGYCLQRGVAVTVAACLRARDNSAPEPSIRLASSRKLDDAKIAQICNLLDEGYENCRS